MDENPYQPPKEPNFRPTARQRIAIGVLLLLTIPAGCICGGVTCFTVAVADGGVRTDLFIWLGIIIGLTVAVPVPVLAVYFFGKRTDLRS